MYGERSVPGSDAREEHGHEQAHLATRETLVGADDDDREEDARADEVEQAEDQSNGSKEWLVPDVPDALEQLCAKRSRYLARVSAGTRLAS